MELSWDLVVQGSSSKEKSRCDTVPGGGALLAPKTAAEGASRDLKKPFKAEWAPSQHSCHLVTLRCLATETTSCRVKGNSGWVFPGHPIYIYSSHFQCLSPLWGHHNHLWSCESWKMSRLSAKSVDSSLGPQDPQTEP